MPPTIAEALAVIGAVAELAKAAPGVATAIRGVLDAIESGRPLTPALKAAEVAAAEHYLGID